MSRFTRLVGHPRRISMIDPYDPQFFQALAAALLDGPWQPHELRQRAVAALEKSGRWVRSLVGRILRTFPTAPDADFLERFLTSDNGIGRARTFRWPKPVMSPHPSATGWGVPKLTTVADLAAWLKVSVSHLEWLADCQYRNAQPSADVLRHYRYH